MVATGVSGVTPISAPEGASPAVEGDLAVRFQEVRHFTVQLTEGLAAEDMVVQSMPDVSPTKWHLAHTSWFFEQFLLVPHLRGYKPLNAAYLYLFNSYYHQAGERHCRDQRGYISRPTVAEVLAYRRHVDTAILELLGTLDEGSRVAVEPLLTLGLHHEQQHQELLLTDIKHVFSVNPLRPVYRSTAESGLVQDASLARVGGGAQPELAWIGFEGGVHQIGYAGTDFAFDNEGPRHRQYLEPFELANRLVTNAEYEEFIEDGGYRRPELWLSLGWAAVQARRWTEPFYWERRDGNWRIFTLAGMRDLDPAEPVCHLTYFEADAYARWAGARLPTEAEWELAAAELPIAGNFVERGFFHPARIAPASPAPPAIAAGAIAEEGGAPPALLGGLAAFGATEPAALVALGAAVTQPEPRLHQLYGDLWEWTSSPYTAYPGFRPAPGAVGEYNGKFMCNQFVLRGGSCATSRSHIRPTNRNFFPPDASWQYTGVRLARDL
jgi:ergothioneine biosynthesis protein EgtB